MSQQQVMEKRYNIIRALYVVYSVEVIDQKATNSQCTLCFFL